MRDLPILLDGYRLTVVCPPTTRRGSDRESGVTVASDPERTTQFVVSLFAKQRADRGQRTPAGQEVMVTLPTDPGAGFDEDVQVELIDPRIDLRSIAVSGGAESTISIRAMGLRLADPPRVGTEIAL